MYFGGLRILFEWLCACIFFCQFPKKLWTYYKFYFILLTVRLIGWEHLQLKRFNLQLHERACTWELDIWKLISMNYSSCHFEFDKRKKDLVFLCNIFQRFILRRISLHNGIGIYVTSEQQTQESKQCIFHFTFAELNSLVVPFRIKATSSCWLFPSEIFEYHVLNVVFS